KIVLVKTSKLMKYFPSDEHTSPGCPKYFSSVVILIFILLQCLKYTTSAKGIAKSIQKSSCCTCIFKMRFQFIIFDFRLSYGDIFVTLEKSPDRINPIFSNLNIGV